MKIPVDKISPNPQQPRKHFNDEYIAGLAGSIKSEGLKEPILVEDNGGGSYTLVDGECRLRAHKIAGLKYIEATIRPPTNHSGKQRLVDATIKNVSRENMNAVDEGQAFKAMNEQHGMSISLISKSVGKTYGYVRNRIYITKLNPEIQEMMAEDRLPKDPEAIDALLSIPDDETRIEIARRLAARNPTVKMVKKHCARFLEVKTQTHKARLVHPALEVSKLTKQPTEWDALYQVGKVPKWQKFTESVMDTCDNCSLRPYASEATCRDCPVVDLCRRLMGMTQ